MSDRTRFTLSDAQYDRLLRESERTGFGLAELVRRALSAAFGDMANEEALAALDESFGARQERELDWCGLCRDHAPWPEPPPIPVTIVFDSGRLPITHIA